jgi:ankyrin repeat protein
LKDLKVTSPCTQDWEEMSGNEKIRFCSHCDLSVNNLSEMTRKEVKQLVKLSDGRLCVRYIQHPKTKAPVFADKFHQITRRTGIAAGVLGATLAASSLTYAQGDVGELRRTRTEKPATVTRISKLTYFDPIEDDKDKSQPAGTGKISGTVTDQTGAVIPESLVKITFGKISKITVTDENGFYVLENIPQGNYELSAKAPNFKDYIIPQVKIEKNSNETINVPLEVDGVATVVGAITVSFTITKPLINATIENKIKEVRSLIARGINVNDQDKGFAMRTALHAAVEENNLKIVTILLNAGADVNLLDEDGNTPLMMLNDETNSEIIKLLVNHGTDPNIQNKDGKRSALLNAAMEDNFKAMRILIEAGAKVNLKDEDGDTALDLTDDEKIRQLLIAYGAVEKSETEPVNN